MFDVTPIPALLAAPPRRDRRIAVTAVVSVLLHAVLIGWLLLPPTAPKEAIAPDAINVDLVPSSEVSSLEPSSSVPPPSSTEPSSSTEPPSSDEPSSEEAQSSAAPAPSGEPSSSVAPESSQTAASSAEAASSEAPSSAEASASSEERPPSGQAAASEASSAEASSAPAGSSEAASSASEAAGGKPLLVPLGPSDASQPASAPDDSSASEAPSAAETASSADASSATTSADESSVLTTGAADASDSIDTDSNASASSAEAPPDAPPPVKSGLLRAAKRFYSATMLAAPQMEKVRKALKTLPPEKRLAQTCNLEAAAQIGSAGKGFTPNALVANAFADPVVAGTSYSVSNGAFRSDGKWYSVGYTCKLSKDMSEVTAFAFHIGADVTATMEARFGPKG
jgi:hypothetical protein